MKDKVWNIMLPVFLCKSSARPTMPSVSLSPRDERWNDFGRNYHVYLEILLPNSPEAKVYRALVMPLDWESLESQTRFDDWVVSQIPAGQSFVELKDGQTTEGRPKFVTLLESESGYRKLAQDIGPDERLNVLSSINDLVFLLEKQSLSKEERKAILETENFRLGFMRRGSAFQALHRGSRHIWGVGKELLQDARALFSFECTLRGFFSSSHTLTIDYVDTAVFEDRIHCLVGKNGCGKTRLLREIILKFADIVEEGRPCFIDNFESTAVASPTYIGPEFRRLLCFAFDSHSNFPKNTRSDVRFEYIYTNLTDRADLTAIESSTSVQNLTRLLVDILRNDDVLGEGGGGKTRYNILRKALKPYIDFASVLIPLLDDAVGPFVREDEGGRKWISVSNLRGLNEKASLILYSFVDLDREIVFGYNERERYELSSGHRVFFKFAISFLSYIDAGTLIIIDEPETHLHPNLVCDFMNLVYEVLSATKSSALVATHSAYVIREVPTHCAHVYIVGEDGQASENQVYLRTLGANIENISQAVFGDSNVTKFHQKIAEEMAHRDIDFDSVTEEFSFLMSPDLLSQIARLIKSQSKSLDEDF